MTALTRTFSADLDLCERDFIIGRVAAPIVPVRSPRGRPIGNRPRLRLSLRPTGPEQP